MNATISPIRPHITSKTALLLVVCLAQFMVILDVSIVNVALPSIRTGLHFSTTGLQWVVNAYTLTFAGFLLLGGRAADLVGRRRMFIAGTALFAGASLACGLADSRAALVVARLVQGVGGAIISPASLAIITTSFLEGRMRNRALGIWGAVGGVGGAVGVVLGGLLTQELGWPAIFFINVPVGLAVVALAPFIAPEGRREGVERHFDVAGAVLATAGLMSVVYGIVRTDTHSWGSAGVLEPIAVGVALLAAFLVHEGRIARAPLMPLSIFRLRQLRSANLVILLLYSAVFAMWFILSLFLQQVLGASAIRTGLEFLPMTLSVVVGSTLAPRFVARVGVRPVIVGGMLAAAAGLGLLATGLHPGASYAAAVLPGGMLAALGLGLSLVPSTIAAMQGVPADESGIASGLLNTSRFVGGALGLAVLSTIAASHTHARAAAGATLAQATASGYALALATGGALCLVGAIAAAALLRGSPTGVSEPVGELVEEAADEMMRREQVAA